MGSPIDEKTVARTLDVFAGLTARMLDDPQVWLGWGPLRGRLHPASAQWPTQPVATRAAWWVRQVGTVVAFAAATPRFFGVVADRLPIQAAFGTAAQGLVVCAVAREYGVTDPDRWVPLLGTVLFDRTLGVGSTRGAADGAAPEEPAEDDGTDEPGRLRRVARAVLRLARILLAVDGLFDERPRGARRYRLLGKVPVVGLLGGFLDERGGIRKAAEETAALVRSGRPDLTRPPA